MTLTLNGKKIEVPAGTSLLDLLAQQGVASELVAIELNEQMVPRAKRTGVPLKDGDIVEFLKMIAGGAL